MDTTNTNQTTAVSVLFESVAAELSHFTHLEVQWWLLWYMHSIAQQHISIVLPEHTAVSAYRSSVSSRYGSRRLQHLHKRVHQNKNASIYGGGVHDFWICQNQLLPSIRRQPGPLQLSSLTFLPSLPQTWSMCSYLAYWKGIGISVRLPTRYLPWLMSYLNTLTWGQHSVTNWIWFHSIIKIVGVKTEKAGLYSRCAFKTLLVV